MARPRTKPLRWPQSIPRSQRKRTHAKPGSFLFKRQALCENEFLQGPVDLSGNLFLVVHRGLVVVEREDVRVVVREGEGALVTAGSLVIAEIPARASGQTNVNYFFFDDRTLRKTFLDLHALEKIANRVTPAFKEIFKIRGLLTPFLKTAEAAGPGSLQDFSSILAFLFSHGWANAFMFLKPFFARRRALNLFLESQTLPVRTAKEVEAAYPAGKSQFRRDFRAHYDMPVERWFLHRRLELAYRCIKHGPNIAIDRIARSLGFGPEKDFRRVFYGGYNFWPEDVFRQNDFATLQSLGLARVLAPFWHWASQAEVDKIKESAAIFTRRQQCDLPPRERAATLKAAQAACVPSPGFPFRDKIGFLPAVAQDPTGISKFLELEPLILELEKELRWAA